MFNRTEKEIMDCWDYDTYKGIKVSISIATYNHENYISDALNSCLMQETNFPFEIVIGEDCSTDNTRNILKKYKNSYPNIIKLMINEENIGGQKNGKKIIENCVGEYIAFCDGDDHWIDPKKLQLQINEMEKYPNVNISFHPVFELVNGRRNKILSKHLNENKIFTVSEVILGNGGFMPTVSLLIKKDILSNLPEWYNDAPVGDYFFQIFGSLGAGALFINRIMGIYRTNVIGSWSSSIRDYKKLLIWLEKMNNSLDCLDKDLNYMYTKEINMMKGNNFLCVAIENLRNRQFDLFKINITKAFLYNKYNLKIKTLYYSKNIKFILSIIKFIKGI